MDDMISGTQIISCTISLPAGFYTDNPVKWEVHVSYVSYAW